MANKNDIGYVYIFTNESFREGWVKIGKTHNIKKRLSQLDNTSCPLPFDVYATLKTSRYDDAEEFVHEFISHFNQSLRIRPNREYFKVDPKEALDILYKVKKLMNEPDSEIIIYDVNAKKHAAQLEKKHGKTQEKQEGFDVVNIETPNIDTNIEKPRLFSQTTLVSYLRNFNSETTKKIVESMGVKQPLAQITDVDLLNKINEAIKVYEKQNGIHHTHSCAVSKYIEYINHGMTYQDFEHDAMLVRNGGKKPNPTTKPKEKDTEKTAHRKAFEFSMIGLKEGDTITFAPLKLDVKINGKNTISYNGKTYTLTGFCKAFLPQNLRNPSDAYQGPKFFTYQGENLWKLRLRNEDKL